ncbi:SGNH/GDSL hydrolase family protein [Paractinoplanes durhamensis]|uniref:SGNH hydrolase-type esterase domain-containing protein n=1 Tax=Paractinoplanes durhamensis TaxID=113563 RepID=A0ABQ3ZA44_9ACTN|nr:SGNH/GDSL hydrolase family protein [Actinoplanes durhamensis]GIE06690.1 hypothetical protein Adu01nite_80400 [Actinoplanes durhamensis]
MRRLALYVVLASLVGLLAPAASASPAAERVHRLKVMPLGDSITYGVGSKTGDGYRYALYWRLIEAGLPVDYVGSLTAGRGPEDANEGHRGWTIEQLSEHVDEWLETYEPDVILLHIGTNDMVRGVPDAPTHLDELLDRIAEDRPAAEVFVAKIVGIADYREVGSRMRRTTAYNAAVTRIVASKGSRFHLVDQSDVRGIDMWNREHPNDYGYQKMAWNYYRAMEPVLNRSRSAWPMPRDPYRSPEAVHCINRTSLDPATRGCRTWYQRTPGVWQTPVTATRKIRIDGRIVERTEQRWITAA